MKDEQDVQRADKDRMGFVRDPAGRRRRRESVTMREMVKLKEKSDDQVSIRTYRGQRVHTILCSSSRSVEPQTLFLAGRGRPSQRGSLLSL